MLERHEAILRAATLGAVVGALVGAVAGLVAYGDRLLVPLYTLMLGAVVGTVLLTAASAWATRPRDESDGELEAEPLGAKPAA